MTGEQRGQKSAGRGGQGRSGRHNAGFEQSEFINLELSKEQQQQQRAWREEVSDVSDVWAELLQEGYRVNTKWDDYSSSYAAFIIPDGQSDNAGYILTGRGGNPYRAVSEALFKHRFLLPDGWATYPKRERLEDDPDF